MTIYIITGPPLSGKSTYIRQNAKIGDIVIDRDVIARSLTVSDNTHDYPQHIRKLAIALRASLIDKVMNSNVESINVWIIHGDPSQLQVRQYEKKGAIIRQMTVTSGELKERMLSRPEVNQRQISHYLSKRSLEKSDVDYG